MLILEKLLSPNFIPVLHRVELSSSFSCIVSHFTPSWLTFFQRPHPWPWLENIFWEHSVVPFVDLCDTCRGDSNPLAVALHLTYFSPAPLSNPFIHLPGNLAPSSCSQLLQGMVQANCIISSVLLSLLFLAWRIPRAKLTGMILVCPAMSLKRICHWFLPFLMELHAEQSPSCLLSRALCSVSPRNFSWNHGNFIMRHFPSTAFGPWYQ